MRRACAENRRSYADDGGAFGDRCFEVVAHSHRELAEIDVRAGVAGFAIAQCPERGEVGPGILVEGRNQHEPFATDSLCCGEGVEQRRPGQSRLMGSVTRLGGAE